MSKLDKALSGKWNWRLLMSGFTLEDFLTRKFGESQGGWASKVNRGRYRTGLWKEILKKWDSIQPIPSFRLGRAAGLRIVV